MLTSVQVAHARRFAVSPRGGFSIPDVERLRARVVATLESYEGTGLPGRDGLTADALGRVVLPSVFSQAGYPMLDVQDFLDEVHEVLATLEQRGAFPAPAAAASWAPDPDATSWTPAPSALAPAAPAPREVAPTDVMPAVRVLASVGASAPSWDGSLASTTTTAIPAAGRAGAAAAGRAAAPARGYGMDADGLVVELQAAIAQSRARGALRVSVQVPGQQLRVMRVVETSPGSITIIAQ